MNDVPSFTETTNFLMNYYEDIVPEPVSPQVTKGGTMTPSTSN